MSSLPPLPEILDKAIETKAFSHKSLFSRLNGLVEDPEENQDNERLVWLGRAAMNAAVSKLLFQTFPRHRIIYLAVSQLNPCPMTLMLMT
jgi:dsRNA-specific ribonuclease